MDSERLRNLRSNQFSAKTIIGIAYLKLTLKKLIDFDLDFSIYAQNLVQIAHTRIRGLISRQVKSAMSTKSKSENVLRSLYEIEPEAWVTKIDHPELAKTSRYSDLHLNLKTQRNLS